MTTRFIIAVDGASAEQETAVTQHLMTTTGVWWHWIKGFWIILDSTGKLSAQGLRDQISPKVPMLSMLVVEIPEGRIQWSGFGPRNETDPKKNMFNWLFKNMA